MNTVKTIICMYLLMFPLTMKRAAQIPPGALKGDFNGDGKPEYLWLVKPKLNADSISCIGPCDVQIVSSNPAIKPVVYKGSLGGTLYNLGDLDNDGKDDIGLATEWFEGCWRSYA